MNIYFLLDENTNKIKIGQSTKLYNRLKTLQTGNCSKLILLGTIINCHKSMEKAFHLHFKQQHETLEWFKNEGKLKRFLDIMFINREKEFDCSRENLVEFLLKNNFSF